MALSSIADVGKLAAAGGTAAMSATTPWGLALGGASELFKLGTGIADRFLANKIDRSTQRPGFEIPAAQLEGLARQRSLAMGEAPGQSQARNLMMQQRAGNTSAILNSGGGTGERMAALLGQNQLGNQAALQMGAQQDQWKAQQEASLINALNRQADWQQQKWIWDKQQPYEQAKAKAAELRGDSKQNIYGAIKGLGGLAASSIGYDNGTPRLLQSSGSGIGTRQAETPTDSITTQNQRIDRDNMGPQGEGPMNGMAGAGNAIMGLGDASVNTGDAATGGGTNLIGNSSGGLNPTDETYSGLGRQLNPSTPDAIKGEIFKNKLNPTFSGNGRYYNFRGIGKYLQ